MSKILKFHEWIVIFLAATCAVRGQQVVVDQHNEPTSGTLLWTSFPVIIAQEFIPSTNALNFVDFIAQGERDRFVTVQLEIRRGTISGEIVETGAVRLTPNGPEEVVHCAFLNPVPVSAGETYVLCIVPPTDGAGFGIGVDPTGGYPAGHCIVNGEPVNGYDFWFREGLESPALPGPDDRRLTMSIQRGPFEGLMTVAVTAGSATNTNPNLITFYVEYSDDLVSWWLLLGGQTTTYTYGMRLLVIDFDAPTNRQRFYRAVDITSATNASQIVSKSITKSSK